MTNVNDNNASPRPWRVERVTRQKQAVIKAADNAIVAVCHADNAEEIVRCVNLCEGDASAGRERR